MKNYHVCWEIDITAGSPVEAAQKALAIVRDPKRRATCFAVGEEDEPLETIDLASVEDGDACDRCGVLLDTSDGEGNRCLECAAKE